MNHGRIAILALCTAIAACLLFLVNPLKVVDPSNPRFNPDAFSFRDHMWDREAKIQYFRQLFPVGTPKEFVDRVLVEAGGATLYEMKEIPDDWSVWRYDEPWEKVGLPGGTAHIFYFDRHAKVVNIYFSLSEYLYGQDITIQKLYQTNGEGGQ